MSQLRSKAMIIINAAQDAHNTNDDDDDNKLIDVRCVALTMRFACTRARSALCWQSCD